MCKNINDDYCGELFLIFSFDFLKQEKAISLKMSAPTSLENWHYLLKLNMYLPRLTKELLTFTEYLIYMLN